MSDSQIPDKQPRGTEESNNPQPSVELTGFQRDLLFTIARLEGKKPHGKTIKYQLEDYYSSEINTGRLYQNLRELTENGFIETYPIDGRTKSYHLSSEGQRCLENHYKWMRICLEY
ncbi:helix-turn-helix transcriptional regulator [Halalkalicoccus ordinarius]|uniref:helix-turn-helix transcriptional regulator n=1 Tax=Halalkalicoccus ordinarius TaxID=3116651 RepID=UPI00300E88B1